MKGRCLIMIGIYKITNKINNHCYIGQSINIYDRWKHEKSDAFREQSKSYNYPLSRALRKYGVENFTFEILEECSREDLNKKEIEYVKKFNSYNDGYNQTLGGDGTKGFQIKLSNEDIYEIYKLLLNEEITQNDIAKKYGVGIDTISEINHGKTRILDGFTFPLRDNRKIHFCVDCGKEIYRSSIRCKDCDSKNQRKVERPSRDIFKSEIRNISFLQLGHKYGVSDKSISKWCKYYNLPSKKSDIKKISDEDWKNI